MLERSLVDTGVTEGEYESDLFQGIRSNCRLVAMPDDPLSNPDDLEHALFDTRPSVVTPRSGRSRSLVRWQSGRASSPKDQDQGDLEALFVGSPGAPSHEDEGDLDTVLFGSDDATGTGVRGAAVVYHEVQRVANPTLSSWAWRSSRWPRSW